MAGQAHYKQFHDEDISVDSVGSDSVLKPDANKRKEENNIEMVEVDIKHPQTEKKINILALINPKVFFLFLAMFVLVLLILIILIVSLNKGGSYIDDNFPWKSIRLPSNAVPRTYDIFLHPNLETSRVVGNEMIQIQAKDSLDFIVIHIKKLNITYIKVQQLSPREDIEVILNQTSVKQEMLYIKLDRTIPKGKYCELQLKFTYNISDSLAGFYKSYYMKNGVKTPMASTQFEPTDARAAFPCFDEPDYKAQFTLAITHTKDYMVLSNMPKVRENVTYEADPKYMVDHFEQSVIMSTYLVAFVVCDFGHLNTITSSGTKVAVYASQTQLDQVELALDVLNQTIPYYEQYYKINYPLPKQDMIAIPDFQAGAMENWGLITYRESSLLYKEGVTSKAAAQWVVLTITHELAHQWFGNLVTMKWWNDLWLNEGFASFMEFVGSSHVKPEWKMMEQFSYYTTMSALNLDCLINSHPISVDVDNPNEINAIFDAISYKKGAAIIRMLQDYLTKEVFQNGINLYLKRHEYENSVTADLWNALSEATNEDASSAPVNVSQLMDYWTLQMGYPLITFTRKGNQVYISQEYFTLNINATPSEEFISDFGYKWMVPLTYFFGTVGSRRQAQRSILHPHQKKNFTVPSYITWIKGNSDRSGVYRVNYDLENWKQLIKVLIEYPANFGSGDRASLIDDAFQIAKSGRLDIEVALNLTRYLSTEEDFVPWATALYNLDYIGMVLQSKGGYESYKSYVLSLLKPLKNKINLTDTDPKDLHLKTLLYQKIMGKLISLGDQETMKWAYDKMKTWMQTGVLDVGADLTSVVYIGGIKYGHVDDWDFIWEKSKNTTIASEKYQFMQALAWTQDYSLLNRYLYWTLDPEKIKKQDMRSVITAVAVNPSGFHLALVFVLDNWDRIIKVLGEGPFELGQLFAGITHKVTSEYEYKQIKKFLSDKLDSAKTGKRRILQSFELMESNIKFLEMYEDKLKKWFDREMKEISRRG